MEWKVVNASTRQQFAKNESRIRLVSYIENLDDVHSLSLCRSSDQATLAEVASL